tara:strand:- start:22 stop:573 length:552 start_codon:yes stop_codon:yes gene_type:complete
MLFHKTFSKKDIINICEILDIEIEDIHDFNKAQLTRQLDLWITAHPDQKFLVNVLYIDDISQLVTHFGTINQSKINSAKTRQMVMGKAKKMIAYGKTGYLFTDIGYSTLEQVEEDIQLILPFGDSPSVRKAINWINNDPKIKEKHFPIISEAVKQKIDEKHSLKIQSVNKAGWKRGHFTITFD